VPINLDYPLTPGTNQNVTDVANDITGVGRDVTAPYRTIFGDTVGLYDGAAAALVLFAGDGGVTSGYDFSSAPYNLFYLNASDYSIPGLTTKARVRVTMAVNGTQPIQSFVVGLYPLTSTGGANSLAISGGDVVSGSTVTFTDPPANTISSGLSSSFTLPSDGVYGFGVLLAVGLQTSTAAKLTALLQLAWTE